MYEWVRTFSSVLDVITNGSTPADGVVEIYLPAIALTVLVLGARIASRNDSSFLQLLAGAFKQTAAQKQHIALSALKTCPKCAGQLPLSTLVCDRCEYNFLSGMVGHRHKLLPAPEIATSNG